MHLIFCIDECDGLSFCGKRLSRDSRLNAHILQITEGKRLWMSAYSKRMFPEGNICIDEDFQMKAGKGDYCFCETAPLLKHSENLESVILYRWNRVYPSTVRFSREILKDMRLSEIQEFPGSSHERITMERYTK